MSKLLNLLNKNHYELRTKINTLESENEMLKEIVKDELYKEFINKLGEPTEMKRLREENRRLRKRNKILRAKIVTGPDEPIAITQLIKSTQRKEKK